MFLATHPRAVKVSRPGAMKNRGRMGAISLVISMSLANREPTEVATERLEIDIGFDAAYNLYDDASRSAVVLGFTSFSFPPNRLRG